MSLVIALSLVLGLVAGGIAYLLFRRRVWVPLAMSLIVFSGSLVWFLTPVCVAIPAQDVAGFNPPIETRTDTGLIGQRYFQRRNGNWYQCKVRIARALFF